MRDTKLEYFFNRRGINYEYVETVLLTEIDIPKSRHNKARLEGELLDWLVERYAADMADGSPFPPIVGFQEKSGLVLATGNHRLAAAEQNGLDEYPYGAYVLDMTNAASKEMLTREMNQIEGLTINDAAAIQHAIYGVQVHGYTARDMAKRFGVKESRLLHEISLNQVITRLDALGVPSKDIPKTNLGRLSAIHSDRVLPEAAKLMRDSALPGPEVEILLRELHPLRSEDAQLALLADWRTRPAIADRIETTNAGALHVPSRLTDAARFKSFMGLVLHWAKRAQDGGFEINDKDRAAMQLQWAQLNQVLTDLLGPAPKVTAKFVSEAKTYVVGSRG